MSVFTAPVATTETLAELAGGDGLAGALNALDTKLGALVTTDITDITASAAELNVLDGATLNVDELNVLDGIPTTLTTTELGYMDGVTSSVQTQIDNIPSDTKTYTNKTIIQKVTSYTPAGAATATLDLTDGNIHSITMPAGNITIAISNEVVGQCFLIELTQDGTGSRTVTWFSTIRWADGSAPILTTTASKRDTFGFRVTGTDTYDGYVVGQNI